MNDELAAVLIDVHQELLVHKAALIVVIASLITTAERPGTVLSEFGEEMHKFMDGTPMPEGLPPARQAELTCLIELTRVRVDRLIKSIEARI